MPNYCNFELKAIGKKENLIKLHEIMNRNYNCTENDEERDYFDKICKYIGVPSIILFMFILFSHWRFDITLLGLF